MKMESALPALEKTLRDKSEDPMVRHEVSCRDLQGLLRKWHNIITQAAEAMGAISASSSLPILKEFLSDPERTVRETCEIAIAKIEWDNSEEGQTHLKSLNDSIIP